MPIEIDIDKMTAKAEELAAHLDRLRSLIALAAEFSSPQPAPVPPAIVAPPVQDAAQGHQLPLRMGRPRRAVRTGQRRAITLNLHTGPATERDLAKALGWTAQTVREVVRSMQGDKLCFLAEHGTIQLSGEGQRRAEWFLKNSSYVVYRYSLDRPEHVEPPNAARGVL